MNANILYDIYAANREHGFADLTMGLAQYKADHPGQIDHDQDKAIREFIGGHGPELAAAFPDQEKFAAAVAKAEAEDREKVEA